MVLGGPKIEAVAEYKAYRALASASRGSRGVSRGGSAGEVGGGSMGENAPRGREKLGEQHEKLVF